MKNQYTITFEKEKMARAHGIFPVSTRQSMEIASNIRGKNLERAKTILKEAIEMKNPIRYTKMNAPHKPGIGPGKYPIKACKFFEKLIRNAEANAHFQGLNVDELVIKTVVCNRASAPSRYGRIPGRSSKRTSVWLVLSKKESKTDNKSKSEKTSGEKK